MKTIYRSVVLDLERDTLFIFFGIVRKKRKGIGKETDLNEKVRGPKPYDNKGQKQIEKKTIWKKIE